MCAQAEQDEKTLISTYLLLGRILRGNRGLGDVADVAKGGAGGVGAHGKGLKDAASGRALGAHAGGRLLCAKLGHAASVFIELMNCAGEVRHTAAVKSSKRFLE